MPTPLKDPALRRRANRVASAADLPPSVAVPGPELPTTREWHPEVVQWWADLRASPVAMLYTAMHWHQALDVAKLRDIWERSPSGRNWTTLQKAQIGLGLDEADRRRNNWRAPVTPATPSTVQTPAAPPAPVGRKRPVRDPRKLLRSVPGGKAKSA